MLLTNEDDKDVLKAAWACMPKISHPPFKEIHQIYDMLKKAFPEAMKETQVC